MVDPTHRTMTIPTLYIGYSMAFITTKQVEDAFNSIIGDMLVESVESCDKTNDKTGRPFKIFFIKFKGTNQILNEMIQRIKDETHVKLNYDRDWFWKVQLYIPKEIQTADTPPPPPI